MINGLIGGIHGWNCLMNIYAPNEDDPRFIRTIFSTLLQHSSGILQFGGGLIVLCPNI